MTTAHGETDAASHPLRRRSQEGIVTALAADTTVVDRMLDALYTAGVPRDLVEVVVSREAARRFYGAARVRRPGREVFSYAGVGGLVGFVGGVVLSLIMVAWPGIDAPGGLAIVQLAGPNFGTIAGATVGAFIGWFRRARPDPGHARAAEAANAIVVSVTARGEAELARSERILRENGGTDVRRE